MIIHRAMYSCFDVRVTVPVSSNMLAGAFLLGGDMV